MPLPDRHHALALQHYEAAEGFVELGQLDLALLNYRQAAQTLARTSDPPFEARAWTRAGVVALELGDVEAAREHLADAVAIERAAGLERELSATLGHVAAAHRRAGAPGEAAAALRESLELGERLGDDLVIGAMAGELGELELNRGATAEAQRLLELASGAFGRAGRTEAQAGTALALGDIARASGDLEAAETRYREALHIYGHARHVVGNARALASLGHLSRDAGKLVEAEHLYDASLTMASFIGDREGIACAVQNLGNLAASRGDLPLARDQYESALDLYMELDDAQSVAGLRVNLANLLATEGHLEEALAAYGIAIEALEQVRAARAVVDVRCLIGQLEARLGRLERAEAAFLEAKRQADALAYGPAQARLGVNLAAIGYARGDIHAGVAGFAAGAAHLERLERPSDAATTWLVAADALLAAGRSAEAEEAVARARGLLGDEEEGQREQLDCDWLAARVAFSRGASVETREDLLALADRLALAGREADSLSARLAVIDRGLSPELDQPLADAVTRAALALAVAPLALDAESAALALEGAPSDADVARARVIAASAAASGLALLRLRAERRLARVLERAGHAAEALTVRAAALARARSMGAEAEVAQLGGDDA